MSTAIATLVTQMLASPAVRWTLIILGVFCFGFVRGCEWKSQRIDAATIRRTDRVIVQPRRPLLPIIRRAEPPVPSQPSEPQPVPDPISTPEAAIVDPVIDAIRDAATKPLPKSEKPAAKQDACGPNGCGQSGTCTSGSCGRTYGTRRGLFGRLR